ncbi:hypothetical protein [Mycobacterium sp. pR1184]|uniref:hypothetical protein n=1 Tax=Mycobacterium sp. pR1184 TaxID=3238981 RepID=UPI00351AC71A
MSGCIEFRNDDDGYLAWLATHSDGYVVNIASSHSVAEARVHHAHCHTINGRNPRGGVWTGPYVKLCGNGLDDVQWWAIETVGQPISPCGTCRPGDANTHPGPHRQRETDRGTPARGSQHQSETVTATESSNTSGKAVKDVALTEGHCAIRAPSADFPAVQAWADDYIRFERRPAWQEQLRTAIREGCNSLEPTPQQILHATFFGPKRTNADVENLVLYNIGPSFRLPGRNGIRFEHGAAVPASPNGAEYAFGYRYELTSSSAPFAHWEFGRTLAVFDWIDFDSASNSKLAHVWLALARCRGQGRSEAVEPASAVDAPFAVRIQVRPPQGRQPGWGDLMKPVFDGVISAFQAHSDATVLPMVTERLARVVEAEPAEIERHLLERRWAALGIAPRLVSPYREGVKWDPADHRCVAGELLAAAPNGPQWSMRGEIVEVTRRQLALHRSVPNPFPRNR